MRVYTRTAFLTLPAGTLFCKGQPWAFEPLCAKGASLDNDFFARDLAWVAGRSSHVCIQRLEAMLEQGESFPLATGEGRDGCYNDEDIFLVYEHDDLVALQQCIQQALALR